ncbi:hypothetical protein N665_0998s0018 [Sinapis alba]|nr:hypothetical protein N665_2369s0003 [Sinapis alba]KAF8079839.1 hypothetical protein N665_0998s0018 [Sinapis alba]
MSLCIICKWIKAQSLERYTPGQSPLPSDTQPAEFYKTTSLMLRGAEAVEEEEEAEKIEKEVFEEEEEAEKTEKLSMEAKEKN